MEDQEANTYSGTTVYARIKITGSTFLPGLMHEAV